MVSICINGAGNCIVFKGHLMFATETLYLHPSSFLKLKNSKQKCVGIFHELYVHLGMKMWFLFLEIQLFSCE